MLINILLFVFLLCVLAILFLWAVVFSRSSRIGTKKRSPLEKPVFDHSEALHAAQSLSEAITFQTVSYSEPASREYGEWARLREYLRSRFPLVHETMEREIIEGYSLLFRWPAERSGEEGSADAYGSTTASYVKSPLLFCGHLDVVPATGIWTHSPFSGEIADGFVWGRGALDCKNIVICLLEAAERLIESGFKPARDIYFAFGHDEEVGGSNGAKSIAKLFFERDLRFFMVLDEGGSLSRGIIPTDRPVAQVAVSEKGLVNLKMQVRSSAGHASAPPPHTALGRLSEAVARVEFRPRPARITPILDAYLKTIAPELSGRQKMMIANLWLFKSKLIKQFSSEPSTNAMIRTTIAPTMSHSGSSANVLPDTAEAVFNVRLLHGETDTELLTYLQDLTADLDTEFEIMHSDNPSQVSDYESEAFDAVNRSIAAVFQDVPVVPSLMCGGTDARHYEAFSSCVFRFCPFILTPDDQKMIHNTDERVLIDSLGAAVSFYRDLIKRLSSGEERLR